MGRLQSMTIPTRRTGNLDQRSRAPSDSCIGATVLCIVENSTRWRHAVGLPSLVQLEALSQLDDHRRTAQGDREIDAGARGLDGLVVPARRGIRGPERIEDREVATAANGRRALRELN